MSEQMEKLMQGLATLFAKPIATYHPTMGLIYPTIHKKLAAELAEEAIARTLNAVAAGMPLPDEAGRRDWDPNAIDRGIRTIRVVDWVKAMQAEGATRFIALSPESEERERKQ